MMNNKKKMLTLTLALLIMLGSANVHGQVWSGATSNDVTVTTNWTPNTVPTATDVATLNNLGTNGNSFVLGGGASQSFTPFAISYNTTTASTTLNVSPFGGHGLTTLTVGLGGVTATNNVVFPGTGNIIFIHNTGSVIGDVADVTINGPVAGGTVANLVEYQMDSSNTVPAVSNTLNFNGGGQGGLGTATVSMLTSTGVNEFNLGLTDATLTSFSSVNTSDVINLGSQLTLLASSSIAGTVASSGSIKLQQQPSTAAVLTLDHANTYTGGTTVIGTAAESATVQAGTATSLGIGGALNLTNGVLQNGAAFTIANPVVLTGTGNGVEVGFNLTLSGLISDTGAGGFTVLGGQTLTLTNTNTYSGGTTIVGGSTVSIGADVNLGNDVGPLNFTTGTLLTTAAVDIERPITITADGNINTGIFADTIGGAITGVGTLNKLGTGSLTLTSTLNTYGFTQIQAGTLIAGTQNLPAGSGIDILASGTLDFVQTTSGDFAGQISGSGNITTVGSTAGEIITLTADSSGFTGITTIPVATLSTNINGKLGGTINVTGGKLEGIGTYDIVNVLSGILHPGTSPGIMNLSTLNQSGGTFAVDINSTGNVAGTNNGVVVASGIVTLTNSPIVVVTSDDGSFYIGGAYTIVESAGVTGTFNPVVTTINGLTLMPLSITPVLEYVGNDVLLDFRSGFLAVGANSNERNVAIQLASITSPTTNEQILLTNLTALSIPLMQVALDELSGSQYAQMQNATELSNQQFIRRLYDPLRPFLTTSPCCYSPCNCDDNVEIWVEGSALQSRINNTNAAHGYKNSGYEVGVGIQMNQDACWTYGAAVTYERGSIHFNIDGHGKTNTVLGALYAAYRDADFYVLGDLVLGGSSNRVNRSFSVGSASYNETGKPKSFQGALYAEGGMNFFCEDIVLQPFLGFEGGYYDFRSFSESGVDPVALAFSKRSYGTIDSRLGVHLTSELQSCGLSLGIDLAWQCRLNDLQDHRDTHFIDFGSVYSVEGGNYNRNSLDAAINVTQRVNELWSFYVTGNGRFWNKAYAYDVVGGIAVNW